ncbi:MAG: hypothetical protein LQ340_004914 [Diploschistes diacapsis]|nr:MAG: hypothetical protein LQ340_004914 [Diploschistes diacapsis]
MPVKQSASKDEFLKALGLNVNSAEDKLRLQQMWEEVTSFWVRNFETNDRHILKPEYASNPGVHRPYKWAHLDPNVVDNAIAQIWKDGRPWSRYYYDRGASDDRKVYNWVLKWLLWHVCRYRDWRNRKSKMSNQASTMVPATSSTSLAGKSNLLRREQAEELM